MEDFPKLLGEQVAILRAESNTGQIYDVNYKLVISSEQNAYSIFEDIDAATKYIFEMAKVKTGYEYIIYDLNHIVLKVLTPE